MSTDDPQKQEKIGEKDMSDAYDTLADALSMTAALLGKQKDTQSDDAVTQE